MPAEIRELAFTLPRPTAEAASYGSLALADGDGAMVVVAEVVDGSLDEVDEAGRDQARNRLGQNVGRAYYEDLLTDLESRADIKRNPLGDALEE